MANEQMGMLEANIRTRAENVARNEFRAHRNFVTRLIHSVNYPSEKKKAFDEIMKVLEDKHCEDKSNEAVRQFVNTYQQIIAEFPVLVEGAQQDAVSDALHDERNRSNG